MTVSVQENRTPMSFRAGAQGINNTPQYAADRLRIAGAAASAGAQHYRSANLKSAPDKDTFTKQVTGQLPFLGVFEGLPLLWFLKRNYQLGAADKMGSALTALNNANKSAFKNIFTGKEGNIFQRIGDFIKAANDNKNAWAEVKNITKAKSHIQNASKAGKHKFLPKFINNFLSERAASKADAAKKLLEKAGTVAPSAGKGGLKGFLKSSGAKGMLIFSAVFEGLFELLPTFWKLGFEKGVKQTAKSAVRITAETAGFIAGDCAGTAIGSAIGSIFGPAGTLIGAAAGFIIGGIGSHYAGKAAKAVLGKSELEKDKEQKLAKRQAALLKKAEKEYAAQLKNNPFAAA